jgi:hypothetical protein
MTWNGRDSRVDALAIQFVVERRHGKDLSLESSYRQQTTSDVQSSSAKQLYKTPERKEKKARATHAIIQRSPLGVDDHILSSSLSSLDGRLDSVVSELGDGLYVINIRSVGPGAKDGADESRSGFV